MENDPQYSALYQIDEAKKNPVSQPFVDLWRTALQSFQGEIGWQRPSNEIRDRCSDGVGYAGKDDSGATEN